MPELIIGAGKVVCGFVSGAKVCMLAAAELVEDVTATEEGLRAFCCIDS